MECGGAPVELYRREVEHQMAMCMSKTTLVKGGDHNSQVGGGVLKEIERLESSDFARPQTRLGKTSSNGVKRTIRPW